MGDHVRNGADGGIMPLKCVDTGGSDAGLLIGSSLIDVCRVGDGDGEHRRFLLSVATIASFATLIQIELHKIAQKIIFTIKHFNVSMKFF